MATTLTTGAVAEFLTPEPFDLTTSPNDEDYDERVLARDIPFRSLCEHRLLPFRGVAHVGCQPDERIDDARSRQEFLSLTGSVR